VKQKISGVIETVLSNVVIEQNSTRSLLLLWYLQTMR